MITESDNFITNEGNKDSQNILFKPNLNNIQTEENNNQHNHGQIGVLNVTHSFLNKSSMMTYAKM